MVDKDTEKFSRESFKEKILRELEEGNRANTDGTFENYARKSNKELSSSHSRRSRRELTDFSNFKRPTTFKLTEELDNRQTNSKRETSEVLEGPDNTVSESAVSREEPDFATVRAQMLQSMRAQEYPELETQANGAGHGSSSSEMVEGLAANETKDSPKLPKTPESPESRVSDKTVSGTKSDFETVRAQMLQSMQKQSYSESEGQVKVPRYGGSLSEISEGLSVYEIKDKVESSKVSEASESIASEKPVSGASSDFAAVRAQMLQSINGQSYSEPDGHPKGTDAASSEDSEGEAPTEEMQSKRRSRRAKAENSERPSKKSKQSKAPKKVSSGKIIAIIVAVLVLAAAGTGFYGYNFIKEGVQPLNASETTKRPVNIPAGASSKQIGDILQKEGIIKNGMIFQYYTKFKNFSGFKSGYYNLAPSMSLSEIATLLEQGGTEHPVEPTLGKILIPEGYTLEQIAQAVTVNSDSKDEKTPFSKEDFMKVIQDQAFIEKMKKEFPKLLASLPAKDSGVKYQLEGYLFPATYEYTKKTTVESLIQTMLSSMNTQLEPLYDKMEAAGLSVNETLSLAAIVEKEARSDDDRRNVAQVFFNRRDLGMTLDSNTGIFYAEGKLGKDTSLDQQAAINTQLDSPFNTYLYPGFGPGPIVSPSLSAIKAVLNPTANNYLYFVADTEGKIYFAQTLEEQNINVQKYVNDAIAAGN